MADQIAGAGPLAGGAGGQSEAGRHGAGHAPATDICPKQKHTFPGSAGRVHDGCNLLVADLRFNAPDIASTSLNKLFKGPNQYCRVIDLGKAPLIFSPEEFSAMPHGLTWDASDIEARMRAWQAIANEENMSAMHA